ncbi:MAG TPA: ATP-binding protein [Moraxellaceae bacterium]|nr:ATP-binding protein [Moraxellaceae bacterium]
MRSIRQQLLLILASILLVTFAVSGVLSYLATAEEVQELFDAQLIENARVLKGVMNHAEGQVDWSHVRASLDETRDEHVTGNDPVTDGHAYEKKIAIQVWTADSRLVLRSPSAPGQALSPLQQGFSHRHANGHYWFVYTTRLEENGHWLIVAERSDVRAELRRNVAASLGIASLVGLALALLLMRRGLQHELKPIDDLRHAIGASEPEKLAPIQLPDARTELAPVVDTLNHLLARVSEGVERERRFLADAAHELRTPLAVLKLQAQAAMAARTPEEARALLERLIGGVDRSTRVVEQLLLLARLDADVVPAERMRVSLDEVARDTLAGLAPLALARHQELVLDNDVNGDFHLQGNPVLLGTLLRNLVENALRHSPEGGEIRVLLVPSADTVQLEVSDSGPGVPAAMLGTLTRRFVRAHQGDTHGSGLGLAIVAHVVEMHGGELRLANREPSGLRVSVTLPRG